MIISAELFLVCVVLAVAFHALLTIWRRQ